MNVLYLILLILAAVCFLVAATGVAVRRVNVVALGLFFWVLVAVIELVAVLAK